jgi:molecular chaperone GrpE (heat shock protein)
LAELVIHCIPEPDADPTAELTELSVYLHGIDGVNPIQVTADRPRAGIAEILAIVELTNTTIDLLQKLYGYLQTRRGKVKDIQIEIDGRRVPLASLSREQAAEVSRRLGAPSLNGQEHAVDGREPAPPPPTGPMQGPSGLEQRLAEISVGLGDLRAEFTARLRYDETKEEAFRQLYDDLGQFRALATAAQNRPVLLDLILLQDRVEKRLGIAAEDNFLLSVRDELLEILERHGVSVMKVLEDRFDPQRQRAVGTLPAPEGAAHNTVADTVRAGYEYDGRVLRASDVIVYR